MFEETEIKLRIRQASVGVIMDHPLVRNRLVGGWRTGMIYNQYFDTTDMRLAGAGVALRLRTDGDQYIQTFKYAANGTAGLSVRNEWDWYLNRPALDTDLLDECCWPDTLKDVDRTSLRPVFSTDFHRTRATVCWMRQGVKVEVEAAIDEGRIESEAGGLSICELEIELRKGPMKAVMELALELAQDIPLMPCDLSKSDRGYQLLGVGHFAVKQKMPEWPEKIKMDDVVFDIGRGLVSDLVANSERCYACRNESVFRELYLRLCLIREYLYAFRDRISSPTQKILSSHVESLLADGKYGRSASCASECWFTTTWGLLTVGLGSWLLSQQANSGQRERNDIRGDDLLIHWLRNEIRFCLDKIRLFSGSPSLNPINEMIDESLYICKLRFIFFYFWSFINAPRPNDVLTSLQDFSCSGNWLLLSSKRRQKLYQIVGDELEDWHNKILKRARCLVNDG